MLCRTLWKSYLLSWRTKLAKLLCLKCFGRMCFVNFSFCEQVSANALSVIHARCALHGSMSLPPTPRSYLLRYPSALRSRLVGSPTSCEVIVSRRAGAIAFKWLTCIVCEPGLVSGWFMAAQCMRTYKVAGAVRRLGSVSVHICGGCATQAWSRALRSLEIRLCGSKSWRQRCTHALDGRAVIMIDESARRGLCHVRPSHK